MNIQSNTTFKAKAILPVNTINVKKIDKANGLYKTIPVSFLQFDPKNKNDYTALANIVNNWKGQLYAGAICGMAKGIVDGRLSSKFNQIYFLTSQIKNIDNLDYKQVLGITHIDSSNPKFAKLLRIQVNPQTKYGRNNREFINIGKCIINSLKNVYNYMIKLNAYFPVAKFYEKQGFVLTDTGQLEYTWKNINKHWQK